MLLHCHVGEDCWESLGLQGDPTSPPKGNQSWIFIGRTDAEAETPIFWPPDVKNWLIGKNPDAGKDEMVGWHHWLNGHELGFSASCKSPEHKNVWSSSSFLSFPPFQCLSFSSFPYFSSSLLPSNKSFMYFIYLPFLTVLLGVLFCWWQFHPPRRGSNWDGKGGWVWIWEVTCSKEQQWTSCHQIHCFVSLSLTSLIFLYYLAPSQRLWTLHLLFFHCCPGGTSGKEPACQYRRLRCEFDPWFRKIPWRRKWQPTPVTLPGESHGQRSRVGYSPWGCTELDMTQAT